MKNLNKNSPERGAVVVEFAILLPFLLSILVGTVEFGLLFYNKQVLTNASREGARAGISSLYTETQIKDIVVNYSNGRLITFGVGPNVILNDVAVVGASGSYPDKLNVSLTYKYTFLVPKLLGFGTDLTLNAETVMNMEK